MFIFEKFGKKYEIRCIISATFYYPSFELLTTPMTGQGSSSLTAWLLRHARGSWVVIYHYIPKGHRDAA